MTATNQQPQLVDRLPAVRGAYVVAADLSKMIWFRTGGPAEVLFKPADLADLQHFLKHTPNDIPVMMLGVGSNLLIRDGGVRGVVVKLGKPFAQLSVTGNEITVGAGAMDVTVAHKAAEVGLAGLEFMRGVPGTVGGALRMNAGAYGREVADALVSAKILDRDGTLHVLTVDDFGYRYRHSSLPEDKIIIEATFKGTPADPAMVKARMDAVSEAREESQPLRTKTGGSTFKNPPVNDDHQMSAWQLVDAAGCRGMARGDAQVSEKHCNFLINHGAASADDLEQLGEDVRQRVKEKTGIDLQWEIRRVGDKASSGEAS